MPDRAPGQAAARARDRERDARRRHRSRARGRARDHRPRPRPRKAVERARCARTCSIASTCFPSPSRRFAIAWATSGCWPALPRGAERAGRDLEGFSGARSTGRRAAVARQTCASSDVVERAAILADSTIEPSALPEPSGRARCAHGRRSAQVRVGASIAEVERRPFSPTLDPARRDKKRAAEVLGVSLKTLYNRLNVYAAAARARVVAIPPAEFPGTPGAIYQRRPLSLGATPRRSRRLPAVDVRWLLSSRSSERVANRPGGSEPVPEGTKVRRCEQRRASSSSALPGTRVRNCSPALAGCRPRIPVPRLVSSTWYRVRSG